MQGPSFDEGRSVACTREAWRRQKKGERDEAIEHRHLYGRVRQRLEPITCKLAAARKLLAAGTKKRNNKVFS